MTTPTPAQADEKALEAAQQRYPIALQEACDAGKFPEHRRRFAVREAIIAYLAAIRPEIEPVAWVYEDELPGSYPYDAMWPHSEVRAGVRVFPVYGPPLASPPAPAVKVDLKTMPLADGRADYFVSIRVGDREVTPHVFREEYKAAYHVMLYRWLLCGDKEPDLVAFGPDGWPAVPSLLPPEEAHHRDFDDGYQWARDAAAVPAEVLPSQSGAGAGDDLVSRAEVIRVIRALGDQDADLALYGAADNARAREYGEAAATRACCAIAVMPAALAKPASEPAGGGVLRDENNPKVILDGIAEALESAGYVHMANKEGVASILAELAALSSPASSSPAEAEALPAGVGAAALRAEIETWKSHYAAANGQRNAAESALRKIAEHPENSCGTSRSFGVGWAFWNVQNIAKAALRAASLSPAPAQAGSAGEER